MHYSVSGIEDSALKGPLYCTGPYVTQDKTAKPLSTGPLLCHISYNLYFWYTKAPIYSQFNKSPNNTSLVCKSH